MTVRVSETLQPFVEPALLRLAYLYPTVTFALSERGITFTPGETDLTLLNKEIRYAIYREKIYAETLSLRQSMIAATTAK